jgi:predicted negative regulator of RcsB-dependent stress response
MSNSDRYEALMLEHLYGLLEPDEVHELEAYLASPDGAALRARAEEWKTQLAGASRMEFPEVHFTPPTKRPEPVVTPAAASPFAGLTMKGVWTKWAVAACVLLVFGGLGGPAAYQFIGWSLQSREVDDLRVAANTRREAARKVQTEHQARRDAVRKEHEQAVATHQAAQKAYADALESARKAIEQKDFVVRLRGPDRIQPGAPNEWQIDTLTKQGGYASPKKIEVVVRDQKDEVLLSQEHKQPYGSTSLKLPTQFWEKVKPGSDLFLEVVAYTDDNRRSVLAERVPLARPVYVTHLVTDKPLYKPGEIVRFRSLTLDRATFLPPAHDLHLQFKLRNPDGALIPLDAGNGRLMDGLKPVIGPDGKPVRGIGTGEFDIDANAPGGEYTLEVVEINSRNRREVVLDTRKFIVNKYVPDIFEKKLEFDGKSYGPGDYVQARVEASRTAGGPMKDARAVVEARVNNKRIHFENNGRFQIVTDQATRQTKAVLNVRFQIPADVFANRGPKSPPINAVLDVGIFDGTDAENIVRPIPLVDRELRVEFFPEGGDLIEGMASRIYFQVRTPAGKPADLKGYITDGTNTIAEVATLTDAEHAGVNRGQGVFSFRPESGKKYFLKLRSPTGIAEPTKDGYPLPDAKADGIVLTALDAVTEKGEAIRVKLETAMGPKVLHVGAYARGRLMSHQRVEVEAGKPLEVKLQGDESLGGVTRVTVFQELAGPADGRATLIPRAERLVYRKPGEQLILTAQPDKNRYTPAAKVALDITALSEKERPAPAILLVAVVNQSIIAMADNKTDRLMPTHFLLAGDVNNPAELEHADFLLTDHPKAGVALDLLLGTQGWRRFAEQNMMPADPVDRREVERMLVAHGKRTSAPLELYRLEEQRVTSEYRPKLEQLALRVGEAQSDWDKYHTVEEPDFRNRIAMAESLAKLEEDRHRAAAAELYRFETRAQNVRAWALPAFLFGLIVVVFGGFALAVARTGPARRRYAATAGGSLVLASLALVAIIVTRATPESEKAYAELMFERQQSYARGQMATGGAMPPGRAKEMAVDGGPVPVRGGMPPPAAPEIMPKSPAPKKDAAPGIEKLDLGQGFKPPKAPDDARRAELAKKQAEKERIAAAGRAAAGFDRNRANVAALGPMPLPGGPPAPALPAPGFPGAAAPIEPHVMPFVVREYAHHRDPSLNAIRSDFTETVYWHPVLVMPDSARTRVEFQLSDDIARYQVLVAGHTTDGRIGAITRTIEARKPFTVDPKLPIEVSSSDIIDVPVRVMNDSDERRAVTFTLTPSNLAVEGAGLKTPDGLFKDTIDLGPNGKGRKVFRLKPTQLSGQATLAVIGNSDPAAEPDAVGRVVNVVPEGFPAAGSFSDMLETRAAGTIALPKDIVKGTLKVRLEVYPTSMADLVKGLDALLREPNGCFEQTSTSNYPNTLILDYLNQTNQANPEAARRARELLDRGYARLTSYECPDTPTKGRLGFEWFGSPDRAHEALTAYGLLQFKDMARVHNVDPELIKRTQQYLLSRRDGSGGFKRNPQALDRFGGAPDHTTNAYIVWALVESDPDDVEKLDLRKEIDAIKAEAIKEDSRGGKDAYYLALAANVLLQRGDRDSAIKLLDRLKEKHFKAGAVTGAETSITRSGGRDLEIETTALAMLGWMRANETKYATTVKEATRWMSQQRGGHGGFGSTQSTILALKALILHAKKSAHPAESGEIKVLVGGKLVATRKFSEKDVEVIGVDIDKPEELFAAGGNADVEIVTDAKHPYPFAFTYACTTLTPASAEKCAVKIETKLGRAEANEGETVPLTVNLDNRQKQGHGMAVAVVGLPAGMKAPTDLKQLIDLREKGVISFFEIRGRELVLYWRELAPEQKISLTVDLVCEVPGEYRGPASRGYLYYNADHKHWVEPLSIRIRPMAPKEEMVVQK